MFIVTKEIDSENISKLCRTCLREDGDRMVCLFVGPAGSSLAAKLRSLSCLEVWQGDGLPEKMCDRCVTRAESALLYREQCRAADRALRQAASKVSRSRSTYLAEQPCTDPNAIGILQVSGSTSYMTASGCKLYQQGQGFVPIQSTRKALRRVDRGAAFPSYQELYGPGGSHLPFPQDDASVQHARIVESQNPYLNFNFGHFGPSIVDDCGQNTRSSVSVSSSATQAMASNAESSNRAACAMHCSLCNRISVDETQLASQDVSRNNENVDLSCDNENVEICENSNQIPQNLTYVRSIDSVENSIRNLSYQRASAINENDAMQNMSFPENIELEEVDEGETDRVQHQSMHPEADASSAPLPRYAKDIHRPEDDGTINGYRASSTDLGYKRQTENREPIDPIQQTKRYRCEACPKVFSQKSKLSAHRFSHSGEQPFKCSSCEKAYASKSKLNAHLRLHTKTNVHRCEVCEKIFSYPSYLREHLKTHNENTAGRNSTEQNFECSRCDKRFRLLKNAKNHEKLHTGKGSMQCEICDKRFTRNSNLKIHLRTHKATRLHKCEYCNKCFVQKGNLVEHVRIHTKVKPFECKMCGKRFAQSGHLKSHEASHASLRQHQCRLCGKRFKLANHLKRHLTLHTGAKAYKCYECNQLFSQSFSLTRHLKRHNESRA